MLKAIFSGVGRWIFVSAFLLATFLPDFGVVAVGLRLFPFASLPVAAFFCAWAVPLALALPLTLKLFRLVSTAGIGGVYAIALYGAYTAGLANIGNWFFWILGGIAILIGWHAVATPLWRWARGIVAVQDAEASE